MVDKKDKLRAEVGFANCMEDFHFIHGSYLEMKRIKINGIRADVLLYDAYKGVSLSRLILFNEFIERKLSQNFEPIKPLPLAIETFLMKTLRAYFRDRIKPESIINPKCGKDQRTNYRADKFNPFKNPSETLLYLESNKELYSEENAYKGNKKVLEKLAEKTECEELKGVYAGTYLNVGYESLKTADRELRERNARLKKVETQLDGFYYTDNFKVHEQCETSLKKIYEDPRNLI